MKLQAYFCRFSFWIFVVILNQIWSRNPVIKHLWEILLCKKFKTFIHKKIIKLFQLLLFLSPLFKWIFIVPWNWEKHGSRMSIYGICFLLKNSYVKCLSSCSRIWSEAFFWKLNVRRKATANVALFANYLKFYWSQVIPLIIPEKGNAKLIAGGVYSFMKILTSEYILYSLIYRWKKKDELQKFWSCC